MLVLFHHLLICVCVCPFLLAQGGISKATRQLHLTEDVFCGCNHTLRGGRIRYKEYISCGKVRAGASGGVVDHTHERARWNRQACAFTIREEGSLRLV